MRSTSPGCAISAARLLRASSVSACSALPIRLVVVSWPALSRKMHWCSSSASDQGLAVGLALDQPRQHVGVGVAGLRAALVDQPSQIRRASRPRRGCRRRPARASAPARARRGSRATSRAAGRARRAATPSRLPMISIGIDAAKSVDQVDAAPLPPSRRAARRPARPGPAPSPRCAAATSAPRIARRTRVCSGGSLKTRLVVWCS